MRQLRGLNHTVADIGHETSSLKKLVGSFSNELCALRLANSDLQKENAKLKDDIALLKSTQNTVSAKPDKVTMTPDLVIGNSILRNIQTCNPSDLEVNCISGITFDEISVKLDNLVSRQKKYGTVHIVADSSDCQQQESSTESITESAKGVIESALKISDKVILSSILPRTDDSSAQLKSENTNIKLKALCSQLDRVSFCDHDGAFRQADRSVNDALLIGDGLHPNLKGTQKIINNLKINATVRRFQRPTVPMNNWEATANVSRPPPLLPNPWNSNSQPNRASTRDSRPANQPYCANC